MKLTRSSGLVGRTHPDLTAVSGRGGARQGAIDGFHHVLGGAEIGRVQLEMDELALPQRHRHFPFHRCAAGDAAHRQMIHRHLGAGTGGAGADHRDIALGHGVDLAIGALHRGQDQGAALQALGVADRRHGDVDGLPGTREGGQAGGDHHGGDVLQLQGLAGRQVDTQGGEHADHALHREGGLRGLVAAAVEADDDAVADQLVGAHAGHGGDVLDALGARRLGCEHCAGKAERGQQDALDAFHGSFLRRAGRSERSGPANP
jgi:hypothetical protein